MPSVKDEQSKMRSESDVKSMSSKEYMDELVVPTMLRALSAVNKERPDDPIEFLIAYLSKERERSESPPPPSAAANAALAANTASGTKPTSAQDSAPSPTATPVTIPLQGGDKTT